MKRTYSLDEARGIAESLAIDFNTCGFDAEQFRAGLDVEAEHGEIDPETNVTNDNALTTGKIALAHLNEIPDYYTRLRKMEADATPDAADTIPTAADEGRIVQSAVRKLLLGLGFVLAGAISAWLFRRFRARSSWLGGDSHPT